GLQVPEVDAVLQLALAAGGGGQGDLALRGQGDGLDGPRVRQGVQELPRGGVPQPGGAVLAAREGPVAARRQGQRGDRRLVVAAGEDDLAGGQLDAAEDGAGGDDGVLA